MNNKPTDSLIEAIENSLGIVRGRINKGLAKNGVGYTGSLEHEAFTTLERTLTDCRARLSTCPGWIRCEDRLPEDLQESYLVYSEYEGEYAYGVWIGDYDENLGSWWDASGDKINPSHWMPLPNPPQAQSPENLPKGGGFAG